MGENTKIEWAHHTFNPWTGCTKVSEACRNCYAESWANRYDGRGWGPKADRQRTAPSTWTLPRRWNRAAEKAGKPDRVFCASLADVFEGPETMNAYSRGMVPAARRDLFRLIEETPFLIWMLLTKRPENVLPMFEAERPRWAAKVPDNIWIGTTVESQEEAGKRIPTLLEINAPVRFLSMEPLLGPVDLFQAGAFFHDTDATDDPRAEVGADSLIDWVIVGGESGPNARPMHPAWARSIRDQCEATATPFHFKQWGEWLPGLGPDGFGGLVTPVNLDGTTERPFDDFTATVWHAGKKAAGRVLDGRTHDGVPE